MVEALQVQILVRDSVRVTDSDGQMVSIPQRVSLGIYVRMCTFARGFRRVVARLCVANMCARMCEPTRTYTWILLLTCILLLTRGPTRTVHRYPPPHMHPPPHMRAHTHRIHSTTICLSQYVRRRIHVRPAQLPASPVVFLVIRPVYRICGAPDVFCMRAYVCIRVHVPVHTRRMCIHE
jgi:hypothetical protein